MAKKSRSNSARRKGAPVPPGATGKAAEQQLPTEPPSDLGDPHAAGTPGGGTAVGGLAGTNVGHGEPENADLERAFGSSGGDDEEDAEELNTAYGGPAGGAVGGTPAGKRNVGGKTRRGLAPGRHRGDSTIGTDPNVGPD